MSLRRIFDAAVASTAALAGSYQPPSRSRTSRPRPWASSASPSGAFLVPNQQQRLRPMPPSPNSEPLPHRLSPTFPEKSPFPAPAIPRDAVHPA